MTDLAEIYPLERVTLRCVNAKAAKTVAKEFPNPGNFRNRVKVVGSGVEITYFTEGFPLHVMRWAEGRGLASRAETGMAMACL